MVKSSGLALAALIMAIGALGIGIYQIVLIVAPPIESGIKHTWYDFHYAAVPTNPATTTITVDQLTIDFTVSSGEYVYFLFNTWADVAAGANQYIQINFVLDGVQLSGPTYPYWVIRTTASRIEVPISCQLSLDTVTPGAHNVTINIFGSDINNDIFSSTLLVQTYIP